MEINDSNVFLIDIDGTICDSSDQYSRWREFCINTQCIHLADDIGRCHLASKTNCIYGRKLESLGIFNEDAMRNLVPYSPAIKALWQVKNGYYVTGRSYRFYRVTLDWLDSHEFPMFSLRMRMDQDDRSIPEIKKETISVLKTIYGKEGQEWILVDDDERMIHVAEELGVTYLKAPECFDATLGKKGIVR